ncbi:MAG: DUF86 domain-containing protein [Tannerella sp.]|jgi:uncharacterized protein with HEPN domain|nr:DUF86 domain-containing protein [Dysgonamonadaceae bacterium]MDR1224839.1 DUF86 domain-containing protein [Tannerella sp.]
MCNKLNCIRLSYFFRNGVIHGYDAIDNGIVWGTIVRHLSVLKKEVYKLLYEYFYGL